MTRLSQSKFTISAGAMIINDQRQILLLNHVLRPRSGWGLPGGFINRGEQAEEAVRREVREETSLEMENLRLYGMRTIRRHIEILFIAKPIGMAKVMSREIYELGWFDANSLPEDMTRGSKSLIEKVLNPEI